MGCGWREKKICSGMPTGAFIVYELGLIGQNGRLNLNRKLAGRRRVRLKCLARRIHSNCSASVYWSLHIRTNQGLTVHFQSFLLGSGVKVGGLSPPPHDWVPPLLSLTAGRCVWCVHSVRQVNEDQRTADGEDIGNEVRSVDDRPAGVPQEQQGEPR